MFKVNDKDNRYKWRRSGVFAANFEMPDGVRQRVFLKQILKKKHEKDCARKKSNHRLRKITSGTKFINV